MKKAISALVSLALSLSLCACDSTASVEEAIDENTYETPLNAYVEYMSTPSPAWEKIPAVYNGWAETEVKAVYRVLQKLLDEMEWDESEWPRYWRSLLKSYESEFGKDAQMSYEIEETKELSKEQLERYQKSIDAFVSERKDHWNENDYVAMLVDDLQISEKLAEELLGACQAYVAKMEDAVIEEGYAIKTTVTISSNTLKENQQQNWTFCVYKVDGRWLMAFWDNRGFYDPVNRTILDLGLF